MPCRASDLHFCNNISLQWQDVTSVISLLSLEFIPNPREMKQNLRLSGLGGEGLVMSPSRNQRLLILWFPPGATTLPQTQDRYLICIIIWTLQIMNGKRFEIKFPFHSPLHFSPSGMLLKHRGDSSGAKFSPENVPLWQVDCFRLINFKKQKTQGVCLFASPQLPKRN